MDTRAARILTMPALSERLPHERKRAWEVRGWVEEQQRQRDGLRGVAALACPGRALCLTRAVTTGDLDMDQLAHAASHLRECPPGEREQLNALVAPLNAAAWEALRAYFATHRPSLTGDALTLWGRLRRQRGPTPQVDLGPVIWRYVPAEAASGGPWACDWCGKGIPDGWSHRQHMETGERGHMGCPGH